MTRSRHTLIWEVGHSAAADSAPDRYIPAAVPGAVQLDWARAQGWPEPAYDPDVTKYAWLEDAFWLYRTTLPVIDLRAGDALFFVCGGVDYRFEVRLNGAVLHTQEGMFTPVELDLSAHVTMGAQLEVLVWPVPKSCATNDRNEANQSVKPAVSYGWDFHPRLVPLGIWDETFLETRPAQHLRLVETRYVLADDLGSVALSCDVLLSNAQAVALQWQLRDPSGALIVNLECAPAAADVKMHAAVDAPQLWWPNGQGAQTLYTSIVTLRDAVGNVLDSKTQRIGFKRARLVMHATQWEEPEVQTFPKGRHTSPITLEINGRRVFAKGANWVSPDIFPGRITAETYRPLLEMAQANHFNMLRCWGGAIVQKSAFFEQCDERGIMVWQEFPLACNRYESTPAYLRVLDQESQSIIQRLRGHVSVTLWCGGNELFNNWSKMTDQDLALRLLNRNCYDMDPERPFLMTSPMMGMGHGGYFFRRDDGAEVYQYFAQSKNTAYTEFGVTGSASAAVLRKIIPASELFPPRANTQWEVRHAFRSWQFNSWLDLHTLEHYFGESQTLEQMVDRSQWLQAEGYKAIFEEARRQKPTCAMAIHWAMNEPWPTAANNSAVSWPAEPKPALAAIGDACRGVLASARLPKFSWRGGEVFSAELWLLNDSPAGVPAGTIDAYVVVGGQTLHALRWQHAAIAANTNAHGPTLRVKLPHDGSVDRLTVELRASAAAGSDSRYTLHYASVQSTAAPVQHTMGDV
jgi:beta-mannosidase